MFVILITLDCVRADYLTGAKGHTPHLDALSEEGTVFTQAFAQSQNTLSSHFSMLTSNYLFQHGVYSNFQYKSLAPHALPRRLGDRGWNCRAFTSVDFLAAMLGNQVGAPDPRFIDPDNRSLRARLAGLFKARMAKADQTLEKGLAWLSAPKKQKNAFLWLHLFDTHMVYDAPRRFLKAHVPSDKSKRSCLDQIRERGWFCTDFPEYRQIVTPEHFPARYKAALAFQDDCLFKFVNALKSEGLWDEALVILTADHGECLLGDHGLYCMHKKLFDTTIHVPLWVRFPGGEHAGKKVDALVQHVDIAPTVAAFADFEEPLYMGKNLACIASGDDKGHPFAFSEHVDNFMRAVRDRDRIWMERVDGSENKWGIPLEEASFFLREGSPAPDGDSAHAARLRSAGSDLLASRPEVAEAWGNSTPAGEDMAKRLRQLGYL